MGHWFAVFLGWGILAALVQVVAVVLAHQLSKMAYANISRAPSPPFHELCWVLNTDDASHVIRTPLSMRKYDALKVLQKRVFNPLDHFECALNLLVDHLLRIDTFVGLRVLRSVNLSGLSWFDLELLEIFEFYSVTHSVVLQVKSEVLHLTSKHPHISLPSDIQVFHLIQFIECQIILTILHELCKDKLFVHFVKLLRLLLDFILEWLLLVLKLHFLLFKLGNQL